MPHNGPIPRMCPVSVDEQLCQLCRVKILNVSRVQDHDPEKGQGTLPANPARSPPGKNPSRAVDAHDRDGDHQVVHHPGDVVEIDSVAVGLRTVGNEDIGQLRFSQDLRPASRRVPDCRLERPGLRDDRQDTDAGTGRRLPPAPRDRRIVRTQAARLRAAASVAGVGESTVYGAMTSLSQAASKIMARVRVRVVVGYLVDVFIVVTPSASSMSNRAYWPDVD